MIEYQRYILNDNIQLNNPKYYVKPSIEIQIFKND